MTLRVPMGLIRTVALLALVWGGAAGLIFAFDRWVEDEGEFVKRSELNRYARDSEVDSLRSQISNIGPPTTSARLEAPLAMLILNAVAEEEMRADLVKSDLFAAASSFDYETCIGWLAGTGTGEVTGREACGRVAAVVDFGP